MRGGYRPPYALRYELQSLRVERGADGNNGGRKAADRKAVWQLRGNDGLLQTKGGLGRLGGLGGRLRLRGGGCRRGVGVQFRAASCHHVLVLPQLLYYALHHKEIKWQLRNGTQMCCELWVVLAKLCKQQMRRPRAKNCILLIPHTCAGNVRFASNIGRTKGFGLVGASP